MRGERKFTADLAAWLQTPEAWWWGVAAMTLLATALRVYRLGAEGFWFDEASTWRVAGKPLADFGRYLIASENAPPLYFFGMHFWVKAVGDSEVAMRFPSLLFGVLTVPATAFLTRQLAGRGPALLAGFFLALSPFHLWHSQEARPYALVPLLTVLSTLALAWAWQSHRRAAWLSYFGFSLAACYTHYYVVYFMAAQALFVVLATFLERGRPPERPPRWLAWALCQAAIALLYLPWLPCLLQQPFGNADWLGKWLAALSPLQQLTLNFRMVLLGNPFGIYVPNHVMAAILVVLAAGLLSVLKSQGATAWPGRRRAGHFKVNPAAEMPGGSSETPHQRDWPARGPLLLGMMAFAPILLVWVESQVGKPMIYHRYLIPVLPFLTALWGCGAWQLGRVVKFLWPRWVSPRFSGGWPALALTGLITLSLAAVEIRGLRCQIADPLRPDWRGLAAYLEANARPGDVIGMEPLWQQTALDYYLRGRFPFTPMAPRNAARLWQRLWFIEATEPTAALSFRRRNLDARCPGKVLGPTFTRIRYVAAYPLVVR